MKKCRGCDKPLNLPENSWIADGCSCNTPRGVNHGLVPVKTCTCTECDPEQTGSTRYESTSEVCASLESEFNAMPTAEQDRRLGNLLTEIYKPPHPADELAEAAVATPAPPEDVVERLRIEEGFARDRSANILARLLAEAAAAIESLRAEYDEEKATRIKYQDIVYKACLAVDRATGRSVRKANLTTIDTLLEGLTHLLETRAQAMSDVAMFRDMDRSRNTISSRNRQDGDEAL